MNSRLIAGIDLGGTNIKAGVFDTRGRLIRHGSAPTPLKKGPRGVLEEIARLARDLSSSKKISRAGVGMPGVFDRRHGGLVKAPNFPGWDRFPVQKELRRVLRVPVVLENDANCAALGERAAGAGKNEKDFLLITLGTGVGGGVILDGELWTGPGGMAGEFGHVGVDAKGRLCPCGARGCVEAYSSATAMLAMAREKKLRFADAREIFTLARAGNRKAKAIVEESGLALGRAFASVIQLLDLRLFLVGGGLSDSLPALLPHIRRGLAGKTFGRKPGEIRIRRGRLGNRAGIHGAADLARFFSSPRDSKPRFSYG